MGLRILKVFAHPLLSESGRRRYRPDPQQGDPETTCSSIGVTIVGVGALTLRGAGKGSGADCAQLVHGRRRAVSVSCESALRLSPKNRRRVASSGRVGRQPCSSGSSSLEPAGRGSSPLESSGRLERAGDNQRVPLREQGFQPSWLPQRCRLGRDAAVPAIQVFNGACDVRPITVGHRPRLRLP